MRIGIISGLLLSALGGCSGQAAEVPPSNVATPTAEASAGPPAAAGPCEITGESTDTDPAGLRVHSDPDLASRELGRLYPGMDPEVYFHRENPTLEEGLVGAQFTVDRAAGDWLHITDIDPLTDAIPLGDRPRPNFQGTGWVHASKVRLIFTTVTARERPDANAPIVADARFFNGYDAAFLRECRGRWARMEQAPEEGQRPGRRIDAWLLSESNRAHAGVMRDALAQESGPR